MASASKPVVSVQVRELVEFALRRGDLGGERDFVGPNRALAGTRGHQRLQRSRPAGYQKEVRLCHDIETADFILRIQGRIDGVLVTGEGERPREPKLPGESAEIRARADARPPAETTEVLLEEIKTVQGGWDGEADPLHWAQAKIYGFIYAHANALEHLTIQLTYLDLDTGELTEFRNRFTLAELSAFFEDTTAIYLDWLRAQHQWCQQRDKSIRALDFPFPHYRPGQRRLAVAAYRLLARGGRLFLEAPTGIGKTISVLFPAVKALGEGKLERIFYLTARTVGRAVAEKALADLRRAGLRLRTLTLTAKEKICLQEGQPCDPLTCPFARGYYDRRKPAMRDALGREEITRPVLEAVSREHQVCPFELSLDLSTWVDVVVCDYNYVFDPRVYLRRHFAEEPGDYAFLVDEAHNLVDRAREMFSADLDTREIQDVRRALKQAVPRCARALSRLTSAMRKLALPNPTPYTNLPTSTRADCGRSIPSPQPSPLGRGRIGPVSRASKHAGFTDARLKGLPLPKGEGRGEGKPRPYRQRSTRQRAGQASRLPSHAPPSPPAISRRPMPRSTTPSKKPRPGSRATSPPTSARPCSNSISVCAPSSAPPSSTMSASSPSANRVAPSASGSSASTPRFSCARRWRGAKPLSSSPPRLRRSTTTAHCWAAAPRTPAPTALPLPAGAPCRAGAGPHPHPSQGS